MAELVIQTEKIKDNIKFLSDFLEKHDKQWSLVTKVFSGDKEFLKHILTDDVIEKINSVGDSRLTSIKNLKAVNPKMRTIYIKPQVQLRHLTGQPQSRIKFIRLLLCLSWVNFARV